MGQVTMGYLATHYHGLPSRPTPVPVARYPLYYYTHLLSFQQYKLDNFERNHLLCLFWVFIRFSFCFKTSLGGVHLMSTTH